VTGRVEYPQLTPDLHAATASESVHSTIYSLPRCQHLPKTSFPPCALPDDHPRTHSSADSLLRSFPPSLFPSFTLFLFGQAPTVLPSTSLPSHLGHRASPPLPILFASSRRLLHISLLASSSPHPQQLLLTFQSLLHLSISNPVTPRLLQRPFASSPPVSSEGGYCFLRTCLRL
jgi:hypothetical protein